MSSTELTSNCLPKQASETDGSLRGRETELANNLQNYASLGIFGYVDMRNKVVDNARREHYAHKDPHQGQEPESPPSLRARTRIINGPSAGPLY
jgi:hypothetical protein